MRRPAPLAALCAALEGADRLVLLGDTLELRHGPQREVLALAAPVLEALAQAVGPGGEIVLVPGNHDHPLLDSWLERRGDGDRPPPLGLEEHAETGSSPMLSHVDALLTGAGARLTVAYPGVWLREDVYATHGQYLDLLMTVPTIERVASGLMARLVGPLPARATPDDFEKALTPLYAWAHAVAQTRGPGWMHASQSTSVSAWSTLSGEGPRSLRGRAAAAAFPVAVRALNRAGLGPLRSELSGPELRRAGLRAIGGVVQRLDVRAEHVLFGHTHRAGPLPADDAREWIGPTGARLHNAGCWIDEPVFVTADLEGPYRGGRALVLEDAGPPRLERLAQLD